MLDMISKNIKGDCMETPTELKPSDLDSAMESMHIGIVALDHKYQVRHFNPASLTILDLDRDQLVGTRSIDHWKVFKEDDSLFSPDDSVFLLPIQNRSHKPIIVGLKNRQGMDVWISLKSIKVSDSDGKIFTYILSFTEVTDLIRAKELLKKTGRQVLFEKQRYEKFIHGLNESMIVRICDNKGKILFANPKFCEITGFSIFEILGMSHQKTHSFLQDATIYDAIWKMVISGQIWKGEIRHGRADKSEYWTETTVIPFFKGDGELEQVMYIEFDVTSRKIAEQSLVATSKLASLGEMAAGVAHEVNNPLAIILSYIEEMEEKTQENELFAPAFLSDILKIKQTALRIASIVKSLRTFSRNVENDPFEFVDLKFIIDEALGLCKERFKQQGIEVRIENIPCVKMECRVPQVGQVFFNLLSNAFDAVSNQAKPWVEITAYQPDPHKICICVTDSGNGIEEHVASRIMQPFFTTKEIGKGTGLGLSISSGIALSHGGQLRLNHRHPNTQFVLELPLCQKKNI